MRTPRSAVLPALASVLLAAAASASPTITPQTLQCDGTYTTTNNTHTPVPEVQAVLQDATFGLRVGPAAAGMGIAAGSVTRALWRFDQTVANVTVLNEGCTANVANCPTHGKCWTFGYSYSDENGSSPMGIGGCVYDSDCATVSTLVPGKSQNPLSGVCGASTPTVTGVPIKFFPLNAHFAASGNAVATFDGASQFGSVTYAAGTWDMGPTYTLSAWIQSSGHGTGSGAGPTFNQRILSEQGPAGYWGFGVNNTGIRHFDSRDGASSDVTSPYPSATLFNGQWHKIDVVRVNGGVRTFYVDGKALTTTFVAASTDSFSSHPISHPVIIGDYEGSGEKFDGNIDEIRETDYPLNADDVLLEYVGEAHKFAADGVHYSTATGGYVGSPVNGTGLAVTYATSPPSGYFEPWSTNASWVFEAQNVESVSTVNSPYVVTRDNGLPIAPAVTGTATSPTAINWTWGAPTKICVSPGTPSPGPYYQLVNGANNAVITPASTVFEPSRSIGDVSGGPNQLSCRRLQLTDVWGTSALGAAATTYTQAAVPTSITALNVSTGGFDLSWNANSNPGYTRYDVEITQDPNFVVNVGTRVGVNDNFTGTTINITGLSAGTTYYVRVSAFNGQNADSFGGLQTASFAAGTIVTASGAPLLSGIPNSQTSVQWTWSEVAGAQGYTLFQSTPSTVLFGPDGSGLTAPQNGLSVNTRYDAQVQAVMPVPTPAGPLGNAFTYTLANPPVGATLSAVYSSSVSFTWGVNGNPAGTLYQVVVATDASFNVIVGTLSATISTITATGLLPGVTYYARVQAFNGVQYPTAFAAVAPNAVTAANPEVTVSSAPASPYVAEALEAGAWQFDEDAGTTTADGSGLGNTGNLGCTTGGCSSTPTWTSGLPGMGSALNFTGQAGVVLTNSGAPFAALGSVSVEAWVNPRTASQPTGSGIAAVGKLNSEDFALDLAANLAGNASFRFLTSNGAGTEYPVTVSTATIVPGQWAHVVGVYDAASQVSTLYLNGRAAAVATSIPALSHSGRVLAIGNRLNSSATPAYTLGFSGIVDSVRVFGVALSSTQVQADYQGGFVSSVTPPSPNRGVIVGLPPNAFGAPAEILISADPVGHPIRVSAAAMAAGLAALPAGLTMVPNSLVEVVPIVGGVPFSTPLGSSATLSIPYTPDPVNPGVISGTNPPLAASAALMYTLNTTVNRWTELPTSVDTVNDRVTGVTPHFSVFALFAPTTISSGLSGVFAFPVPWKPGSGGRFDAAGVTFSNLPVSGTIEILTLAGRRVREFSFNGVSAGSAVWDGLNDDGRRTASGVYFAKISSGADATTLVKFAVER